MVIQQIKSWFIFYQKLQKRYKSKTTKGHMKMCQGLQKLAMAKC